MSYEEKKLNSFKNAIIKEAEKKAQQLIENAFLSKTNNIKKFKEEISKKETKELEKKIEEIKAEYNYKITKKSFEIKKEILEFRNRIKEEILNFCKQNILNFTKTIEYKEYLIEKIKSYIKKENIEKIIIEIKEEDLKFESEIKNISTIVEIEKNKKINLGGFKLIDIKNKIEIDETFDSALENNMKCFYKTTKLNVKNF